MELSDLYDNDDEEIDWEEVESRLYSQIYHAAPEEGNDPVSVQTTVCMNTEITGNRKKYRYFEKLKAVPNQPPTPLSSCIYLDNVTQTRDNYSIPTIQKHISTAPIETRSTVGRTPTHVHNNITVNQYSIPQLILQSDAISSSEQLSIFSPCMFQLIGKGKILDKKKKRKEKLLRRLDRRRNNKLLAKEKKPQNSVTIFIDSDFSDSECVVVENKNADNVKICTEFPKKYDENNGGEKPEDDDEVIYIPPPPIEVINVDLEETLQELSEEKIIDELATPHTDIAEQPLVEKGNIQISTGKEHQQLLYSPESPTSNDFLDNVSCQGSDANNRGDFVKPTNPIEYCETESSCSTNEHSRDFSNTVKTIVFNEVDFPKDDIFSDKNLEDFRSFLTPKRTSNNSKEEVNLASLTNDEPQSETVEKDDSLSDDSSSESDYEETDGMSKSTDKNKNLPSLSLMIPPDDPKKVADKIKSPQVDEKFKNKKKRKKKKKASEEVINTVANEKTSETSSSDKKKKKPKKKRQSVNDDEVNDDSNATNIVNKKQKKRKSVNSENPKISTKKKKYSSSSTSKIQDDSEAKLSGVKVPDSSTNSGENIESNQAILSTGLDNTDIISAGVERPITSTPVKGSIISEDHLPMPDLNNSDFIVIDETLGDETVIVPSGSESDNDFQVLNDVGNDMTLANCSKVPEVLSNDEKVIMSGETCSLPTTDYINFDVDSIQQKQSDDPEKWQISFKDKALYLNLDRARGPRCNRCRQFGHIAIRCSEKPSAPSCILCGEQDHQEPRCPNKRCTQCGNKGNFSTTYCWKCFKFRHTQCHLCNMRGHIEHSCPDLWRRYHSTTDGGPIVETSQEFFLTRDKQWCSGCARQGHLEHECNYYNREYPPTTPFIMRYDDNLAQGRLSEGLLPSPSPKAPEPSAPNVRSPNRPGPSDQLQLPVVVPGQGQVRNPFATPSFGAPRETLAVVEMGPSFTAEIPNENALRAGCRDFYFRNTQAIGGTEIDLTDITKIKHLIMSAQADIVREFLAKEMEELGVVANCNFKLLRKKLFKYDKVFAHAQRRETRKKRFWFRILNMLLFGVCGFLDGKVNCNVLKNFLGESKLTSLYTEKRKSLFSAYSYICGCDKHNLNYYKMMQLVIQNQEDGKLKKLPYYT